MSPKVKCSCTTKVFSSSLVHPPREVVSPPGGAILLHQLLNNLPALVHLVKVVLTTFITTSSEKQLIYLEHWVFSELVNEGLPLPQFVVVSEDSLKQAANEE